MRPSLFFVLFLLWIAPSFAESSIIEADEGESTVSENRRRTRLAHDGRRRLFDYRKLVKTTLYPKIQRSRSPTITPTKGTHGPSKRPSSIPSRVPSLVTSSAPSSDPGTQHCDQNIDCELGLICGNQDGLEPDSEYGTLNTSSVNFCIEPPPNTLIHYGDLPADRLPLGNCQGDCDSNSDCANRMYCFQREPYEIVPGCMDGELDATKTDFCVEAPPGMLISNEGNPPDYLFPLGDCEGDCDNDNDCDDGLICFQRDEYKEVPGCMDGEFDESKTDYCVIPPPTDPPYYLPTPPNGVVTYHPGNLTTFKDRLLLSEGLDSRLIATSDQNIKYANGSESSSLFHGRPDAGATFPDQRPQNLGGWVYVSNSEVDENGGGVGAITFDKDGNIIDYRMVFEGSTWNCGGGRTPWNTWVSCEESPGGKVYQVDPFGEKNAQEMILGSDGGTWESFAYDIRDPMVPRFFVTEDNAKGALARYTPSNPDWNNTWDILHGAGTVQYLVLRPNQDGINGTFSWTANRSNAKQNAQLYYPHSEGIDVYGSQLFFVCKQIRMLFTLDLDGGTYKRSSTQSGLFDGGPDQLKRILNDDDGLLYFTEEGGKDSGIHARDNRGRFYTILESPELPGETTGLAFSPDSKFVYVAYQDVGMLYAVWRRDGFPFDSMVLDVKYHEGT